MAQSLFEQYGGFAAVSRIVSAFYDRVLESDDLSPYFDGIDMRRLIDHQTKFVATLMGGPSSYTDDQLQRAHSKLGIKSADFDEAMDLLKETLEDFDFDETDISAIVTAFSARRPFIVTAA